MNKSTNYFGIDISKDFFDVMDCSGVFYQFKNDTSGFKKLNKHLDSLSHCVMESIGVYHLELAYFLIKQ